MNKLYELHSKADEVIPIHTVTRPVWGGSMNVYKEIKNKVFENILKKYYNNSSVIWLILECQRLLNYDIGSKEQSDINVVFIWSDLPQEPHRLSASGSRLC